MPGHPATSALLTKKTGAAAFRAKMSSQVEWFATMAPAPCMGLPRLCQRMPISHSDSRP